MAELTLYHYTQPPMPSKSYVKAFAITKAIT
jgi:hypothetical protein